MKRIILTSIISIVALSAGAQVNLQLHGDFGRLIYPNKEANRQIFTSTIEFYHPDKLGSTYFFVDLDYTNKKSEIGGNKGMIGAYWEISREFTFAKLKDGHSAFAARIEYDGGCKLATSFQQSLLVGPTWNWHSKNFSKTLSAMLLYKQYFTDQYDHSAHPSVQGTILWGLTFSHGWLSCNGFADIWYGYKPSGSKGCVFLTEPQLWVNVLNKAKTKQKLAIGTEVEISSNFNYPVDNTDCFFINPTLALKWTF